MAVYISIGGALFTEAWVREGLIRSLKNYFQVVVAGGCGIFLSVVLPLKSCRGFSKQSPPQVSFEIANDQGLSPLIILNQFIWPIILTIQKRGRIECQGILAKSVV